MDLATYADGDGQTIGQARDHSRQRQNIADLDPPHQATVMLRSGPAPNLSESCATSTVTCGPSNARKAAG